LWPRPSHQGEAAGGSEQAAPGSKASTRLAALADSDLHLFDDAVRHVEGILDFAPIRLE
jgi:hypothetical protein